MMKTFEFENAKIRRTRGAVHERLRRETGSLHQELEARLDLLGPSLDVERYTRVLEAFVGYYAPLEHQLRTSATHLAPRTPPLRFRVPLLERDLLALGVTVQDLRRLPACAELPHLATPEAVAGCAYVIEGASLGGRIVARALRRHLGLTPQHGAAFFHGDDDLAARWGAVLAWLEQIGSHGTRTEEIVLAAIETFRTFGGWLAHRGVAR